MRVRWFAVFDQALRSADVIAVWATVEDHLERPLTRAELAAARRAANRYAAASNIRCVRIPAPAGTPRVRTIPLLARTDADLDDIERLTSVASGKIGANVHRGRSIEDPGQRTDSLVHAVAKTARSARLLRTARIEPDHATALAEELANSLTELHHLEQRLRLRGRRGDP